MELLNFSVIPIFFLILLGYFFKKISFPSNDFWPLADKLTYFLLMPTLLIISLKDANLALLDINLILSLVLPICVIAIFLIILNKIIPTSNGSFTSIMQGATRFNTYIFLALCGSLYGNFGLEIASLLMSFVIIFLNVLNITFYLIYQDSSKINIKYFFESIFKNPLIIACILGIFINIFKISIPIFLDKSMQILSSAALVFGILSIGFALVLNDFRSSLKDIFNSSFAKFILFPALTLFFCKILNIDEKIIPILILFSIMPTATSAFILARQLGGNYKLMGAIITIQTLISMPVIMIFLEIYF